MKSEKIKDALTHFISFVKNEGELMPLILLDTPDNKEIENFVRNYIRASLASGVITLESEATLHDQRKKSSDYSMVLRTPYLEAL